MEGATKRNKRNRRKNHHHLIPKSRGGDKRESNLLLIDIERHCAWHKLFGNKTLDEVIEFLIRIKRAKENQKFNQNL